MNKASKKNVLIVLGAVVLLAAVLIIGFVAAKMLNSKAEAETEYYIPDIKDGKYYLNADVQSGVYVLVENGMVALCGSNEDIERLVYDTAAESANGETPSETALQGVREQFAYDTEPHSYHITPKIGYYKDWDCDYYGLMNNYTQPDKDGFCGGTGFWYDGSNRLTRYYLEFVYVG